MNKLLILSSLAVAVAAVGGYSGYMIYLSASTSEGPPSEEDLPNSVIVNRTNDLQEVKAFLAKYPDASIIIKRGSDFEVDYYIAECTLKAEVCFDEPGKVEPHIGLEVRLDNEGYPTSSVLECSTDEFGRHTIKNNIIETLDEEICQF